MQFAQTSASKALVAVVAAAMMFSAFVAPAKAATVEELQAQIAALMAQISALSGQGGTSGSVASGICPFTWTMDLKTGSTGADVMKLQQFLNANADTRVAASGAGSVGAETQYYGPATAAAVSKFQVMHRADILTPAGLTNPTGFFGPSTRAKANALCTTSTTPTTPGEEEEEENELSGEASLDNFEVADGEDSDDIEEGSEDLAIGEFTVEFTDGDAEISRLDIALQVDSGNDGDDRPWNVFETVSLWVDGDEVASFDATEEDDYLDEDDGSIRFSDLDIVAMEDEELVIEVRASVQSSIDGAANGESWNLAAGAIRFFDADGVATTEDTEFDLQDISGVTLSSDIAEFTIEEAGAGDDLNVEESDENPDTDTLALDEDSNVEHLIFAFDLSAEDSDGDIEINEVTIVATSTVASNMDDLVNDFRLEIGDDSYEAESYTGTGSTVTLTFDVDGESAITADELATAKLYADFEDMESNDEGSTIIARVTAVEAEGATSGEDVSVDGLPLVGDLQTLRTAGVSIEFVDDTITLIENSDATTTDNEAKFLLEFEVTAFGDTVYLPFGATASTTDLTEGIVYSIINTNTNAVVTTGTAVPSYDMDGDAEDNSFKINDGGSETFTLEVEYDPATAGSYKVRIDKINYALSDVATATASQDVSAQNVDTAQTTISN